MLNFIISYIKRAIAAIPAISENDESDSDLYSGSGSDLYSGSGSDLYSGSGSDLCSDSEPESKNKEIDEKSINSDESNNLIIDFCKKIKDYEVKEMNNSTNMEKYKFDCHVMDIFSNLYYLTDLSEHLGLLKKLFSDKNIVSFYYILSNINRDSYNYIRVKDKFLRLIKFINNYPIYYIHFVITTKLRLHRQKFEKIFTDTLDNFIKTKTINMINNKISKEFIRQLPKTAYYFTKQYLNNCAVYLHGDFHGEVTALKKFINKLQKMKVLDGWKIIGNNMIAFLGDYVDRGDWGIETLYMVMVLYINNPKKVIIVKGNHENIELNANYGFVEELRKKFQCKYIVAELSKKINLMYRFLPLAAFLITPDGLLQSCHGLVDPRINIKKFLENTKYNKKGDMIAYKFVDKYTNTQDSVKKIKRAFRKKYDGTKYIHKFDSYIHNWNIAFNQNYGPIDDNNAYLWMDIQYTKQDFDNFSVIDISCRYRSSLLAIRCILYENILFVFRAHQHSETELNNNMINGKGIARFGKNGECTICTFDKARSENNILFDKEYKQLQKLISYQNVNSTQYDNKNEIICYYFGKYENKKLISKYFC